MKKIKLLVLTLLTVICFAACNNNAQNKNVQVTTPQTDSIKYTVAMVDNAKDPTCGMPTTAGLEDTAHYNNKVIGFCSKECKDDFFKNATKNFAVIEWKK